MSNEILETTAEALGEALGIPKERAYTFVKFGEDMGWITKAGNMPTTTGRGRGATIYRVPADYGHRILKMWDARKGIP